MSSPLSLLMRRRRSKRVSAQADSTDGLMDISHPCRQPTRIIQTI